MQDHTLHNTQYKPSNAAMDALKFGLITELIKLQAAMQGCRAVRWASFSNGFSACIRGKLSAHLTSSVKRNSPPLKTDGRAAFCNPEVFSAIRHSTLNQDTGLAHFHLLASRTKEI